MTRASLTSRSNIYGLLIATLSVIVLAAGIPPYLSAFADECEMKCNETVTCWMEQSTGSSVCKTSDRYQDGGLAFTKILYSPGGSTTATYQSTINTRAIYIAHGSCSKTCSNDLSTGQNSEASCNGPFSFDANLFNGWCEEPGSW